MSALSAVTGIEVGDVERRLARGGKLVGMGLIGDDKDGFYEAGDLLRGIVNLHGAGRDAVERYIVPEAEPTRLAWQDFAHLGALRNLAERILRSGKPVSILLYGEPGTGKSEFARALARQVGSGAAFAGLFGVEEGTEPMRSERLAHLAVLRRVCSGRDDRIIVVDEADDVLSLARERLASKQFVNRLIEDPRVSTIWILNDPDNLDPAARRRMILAIRFDQPAWPDRRRIALRTAEAENLALPSADADRLAAMPANAALIASGLRAASLSGGGVAESVSAIASVLEAMNMPHRPERAPDDAYDPGLSSADIELPALADRLAASPSRCWSLLLSGPSGTGKTAFARHLAQRLGVELEVLRASSLLGAYVGESERNIAQAFSGASKRGAMLLIDEADSFLYDRERTKQSWEVTLVNEMLCQLEQLETPFVATTNRASRLDPATQRRFTLRVGFAAMTPPQAAALFAARFEAAWPSGEPLPEDQTPGDFAVVAARAGLLGERDPRQLVRWLREEADARGERAKRPMGFSARAPAHRGAP